MKHVIVIAWVLWSVGYPATITPGASYVQMSSVALGWFDRRPDCEMALTKEPVIMGKLACLPAGLDPEKTRLYRLEWK